MSDKPFNLDLIDTFPDMFKYIGAPGMVSVPPGWERIAKQFCTFCTNFELYIHVLQIKQKMGGLRIYYEFQDGFDKDERVDLLKGYLLGMEGWALHTCQYCGNPGTQKNLKGYWCVICDHCKEAGHDEERY